MLTKIIGAIIGTELNKRACKRDSEGAVLRYFAPFLTGTMVKIGILAAIGYGVMKVAQSLTADDGEHWF